VKSKAEVLTLTAREAFYASQVQPDAGVSVLLRYNGDIDSTMRVKHGTRFLYIDSVVHDARRDETQLLCHEAL
jgi:SPP1 family predicted phage head-tail adaptor